MSVMQKKQVRVRERDIRQGKRGEAASCPIALAFRRALDVPPTDGIYVSPTDVMKPDGHWVEVVQASVYRHDEKEIWQAGYKGGVRFINEFDYEGTGRPITLTFSLVDVKPWIR